MHSSNKKRRDNRNSSGNKRQDSLRPILYSQRSSSSLSRNNTERQLLSMEHQPHHHHQQFSKIFGKSFNCCFTFKFSKVIMNKNQCCPFFCLDLKDKREQSGYCFAVLIVLSYVLVVVTFPLSLCFCLKVCILFIYRHLVFNLSTIGCPRI